MTPEQSERAQTLTTRWLEMWDGIEPASERLRLYFPERWVRFHLDSPRMTGRHRLRRFRTLQETLAGPAGLTDLVVLACDWVAADSAGGWTKRLLPGAWPWRSDAAAHDPDDVDEGSRSFYWVSSAAGWQETKPLVRAAMHDDASFVLANRPLTWLCAPYYAGVDIFTGDDSVLRELRIKYGSWLSTRADGL